MKPKIVNDVLVIGPQGFPLSSIDSIENYPLMNQKMEVQDKTILHMKDKRNFHTNADFKDIVALINGNPNTLNGIDPEKLAEEEEGNRP